MRVGMDFEYILEMVAISSFAVFGANAAIEKKMDIFGVIVLACVTAVGGGFIRDLILKVDVPVMFATPMYCTVATLTAIVIILVTNFIRVQIARQKFDAQKSVILRVRFNYIVTVCDAIGMGYFAIAGVNITVAHGFRDNIFMCIFIGVLTAVGGGMLRDMMLARQPMIFRKEIYATAAIVGSLIYYFIEPYMNHTVAVYLCTLLIAGIRMYTYKKNLNLPALYIKNGKKEQARTP